MLGLLAVVAGTILTVCLPPARLIYPRGTIVIEALGTRNEAAKSAEVWIARIGTAEVAQPLTGWKKLPPGWEERGQALVSYRHQPATLVWSGEVQPDTTLVLAKHSHSGKARVTIGQVSTDYDLYAPVAGQQIVDISAAAAGAEPSVDWSRVAALALSWLGLVAASGLAVAGIARAARILALTSLASRDADILPPGSLPAIIGLAAPSVVTYAISLLAFWPGQLSPDSLGQWREATVGPLTDGFSLPHSAFIWLMARISPVPAFAIGAQALLLALAVGFTLAELRNWRVPTAVLAIFSLAIALWPANIMMSSVLWKDVLFAAGATGLLGASLVLVRTRGAALQSLPFAIALITTAALTVLMRVNMLPAAFVIGPLLLWLYPRQSLAHRLRVALPIAALPLLLKLVIIPVFDIQTLGPHYRAINAIHVIGAYARQGRITAAADKTLLEEVMPLETWSSGYNCENVVPLFFPGYVNRDVLAKDYGKFNRLALSLIAGEPSIFLAHQACVTAMLWKILPRGPSLIGTAPLDIADMQEARDLHLSISSKLPKAMEAIRDLRYATMAGDQVAIFWRPALPLLLLTIVVLALAVALGRIDALLLALPSWLNTASLAALMGAPDYRYQFAVVLAAFLVLPILFVRRIRPAPRPPSPDLIA